MQTSLTVLIYRQEYCNTERAAGTKNIIRSTGEKLHSLVTFCVNLR